MTPLRIQGLDTTTTVAAGSIGAAVAAAFGTVVNDINAVLFVALTLMFATDAAVGTAVAFIGSKPGDDWFDWPKFVRGGVKKGVLLGMILAAALVETAAGYVMGGAIADATLLTKYALSHALVAQAVSIWRNGGLVKELAPLASALLRRATGGGDKDEGGE